MLPRVHVRVHSHQLVAREGSWRCGLCASSGSGHHYICDRSAPCPRPGYVLCLTCVATRKTINSDTGYVCCVHLNKPVAYLGRRKVSCTECSGEAVEAENPLMWEERGRVNCFACEGRRVGRFYWLCNGSKVGLCERNEQRELLMNITSSKLPCFVCLEEPEPHEGLVDFGCDPQHRMCISCWQAAIEYHLENKTTKVSQQDSTFSIQCPAGCDAHISYPSMFKLLDTESISKHHEMASAVQTEQDERHSSDIEPPTPPLDNKEDTVNSPRGKPIQISISYVAGTTKKTIISDTFLDEKIGRWKKRLEPLINIPLGDFYLIFDGIILSDYQTVSYYGIRQLSSINLVVGSYPSLPPDVHSTLLHLPSNQLLKPAPKSITRKNSSPAPLGILYYKDILFSIQFYNYTNSKREADWMNIDFTKAIFSYEELCRVAKLLRSKDGVEISDRRVMLVHMYPKCFVASEAVKWIQNNLSFTKEQAIFFCQLLTTREFIHHCQNRSLKFADNAEFWRFQYHEEGALNWKHVWVWDIESPPCKIVERLSENLLNLCKNAMEKDSKMDPKDDFTVITSPAQVFSSLVLTPEFENFEYSVAELQKVQLNGLDSKEKLAFWLNTYNLLSLHAIIVSLSRGENPYEGFISRKKYFSTQTYIVANMTFSLDDIEHGILRPRNNYFGEGDERAQFKIDGPDARIFSVLSCYNKSSPKTLIIKSENVDRFVDYACRRHFTSVKFQDYTMFIPKICDWYSSDYGTRDDLIKFVQSYLRHDQSMMLNTSFKTGKFSLKYLDFDWEIAFDLKDYNLDLRDPLLKNF